jgi:hypothetical protein
MQRVYGLLQQKGRLWKKTVYNCKPWGSKMLKKERSKKSNLKSRQIAGDWVALVWIGGSVHVSPSLIF